jgi:phosphoribosylglycinamide formyltransferase 1
MTPLSIAVIGSGKGSNFRSILEASQRGDLAVRTVLVASDQEDAGILRLARDASIPTHVIRETQWRTRLSEETEASLADILVASGARFVVLAGFMRLLKGPLLRAFPRRIVNIHPSLLPAFPGLEAWRQALEAGVATTGCTVHLVDHGMDTGPVLDRAEVPVLPNDTPETLHARIQEAEHLLYPSVLARLAAGDLP